MNLLPTRQKKRVKLLILFQNTIFSGLVLILLILILIFVLGGALIFLNFKFSYIEKKIVDEQLRVIRTETVKGMERKVRELNKELIGLKEIQNKQSNLYQALDKISQDLFKEVEINSLEIDRELNKITITGHSDTREKLLAIKQTLENSSNYKNIDFPLANLTEPEDIDFQFSFTLHLD